MQAIGADETRFMKFLTGQNEDGNKHRDATKKKGWKRQKKGFRNSPPSSGCMRTAWHGAYQTGVSRNFGRLRNRAKGTERKSRRFTGRAFQDAGSHADRKLKSIIHLPAR